MAEQRDNSNAPPAPPMTSAFFVTDELFLQHPQEALGHMRNGADVIVEPTNGCARMLLSATLLSEIELDE